MWHMILETNLHVTLMFAFFAGINIHLLLVYLNMCQWKKIGVHAGEIKVT